MEKFTGLRNVLVRKIAFALFYLSFTNLLFAQNQNRVIPGLAEQPVAARYTKGNQTNAAVAVHSDNSFVVVWQGINAESSLANGTDIYMRRYYPNGTPKDQQEIRINTYKLGDQTNPSIDFDANGNFVIVWESAGQEPNGDISGIYARRYSSSGNPIDVSESLINQTLIKRQGIPSVIIKNQVIFIVWRNFSNNILNSIYGRAFLWATGFDNTFNEMIVSDNFSESTSKIDLSKNPESILVTAVWEGSDMNGRGVRGVVLKVREENVVKGDELLLNNTINLDQKKPTAAYDTHGNLIVAWSGNGAGQNTENIFVRKFNISNDLEFVPASNEITLIDDDPDFSRFEPQMAVNSDDNCVLVYHETEDDETEVKNIKFTIDQAGNPDIGEAMTMNTYHNSTQQSATIAMQSDDSYWAIWQSLGQEERDEPNHFGIFKRSFYKKPTIVITNSTFPENTAPGFMIGEIRTFDGKENAQYEYSIFRGDNVNFSLLTDPRQTTPLVTSNDNYVFDYERQSLYTLNIMSIDVNNPDDVVETPINIRLININEAATTVIVTDPNNNVLDNDASLMVAEDTAPNTVLFRMSTDDNDVDASYRYEIVGGNEEGVFTLNGTNLLLHSALDFESTRNYELTITAVGQNNDVGFGAGPREITIEVTNVNEAPTNITLSGNEITENKGADIVIGSLSAQDPENDNVSFVIKPGEGDSYFYLSGNDLLSAVNFDFEMQDEYTITIVAVDGSEDALKTEKQFTINILNVDDEVTAISENNYSKELLVYPNPTNAVFAIRTPFTSGIVNLSLYNAQGLKVLEREINSYDELNVEKLTAGVYYLMLSNGNNKAVKKVIVN